MNKKYLFIGFCSGVIAFILLATLVVYLKFGSENDVRVRDQNQKIPQIHLTDLDLVDLNGTAVDITKYFGRPILLNFWASWCTPCVGEFPVLDNLNREGKVEVITISEQKIANIQRFKEDKGYSFVFLKSNKPLKEYDIDAIPVSVLINSKGIIEEVIVGSDVEQIKMKISNIQ